MEVSIRHELSLDISAPIRPTGAEEHAAPQPALAHARPDWEAPRVSPSLTGNVVPMPQPDAAKPLHETMLGMVQVARRRGMAHEEHSLPACELLLELHAPAGKLAGDPCEGCREPWPCKTVLEIIGGLIPATASPSGGGR